MRRIILSLATLSLLVWASPVLAQSESSGGSSGGAAGGSSSSGSNSSSVSIHTSGGSMVGVAQGSVSGGSRASGCNGGGCDQEGAATSGGAGAGQTAGVVTPVNAVEDGVVNQANLPALDLGGTTQTAGDSRPDFLTWAIAAVIVIGLVVLYRRMPRAARAA